MFCYCIDTCESNNRHFTQNYKLSNSKFVYRVDIKIEFNVKQFECIRTHVKSFLQLEKQHTIQIIQSVDSK